VREKRSSGAEIGELSATRELDAQGNDREIVTSRVIDAPRGMVFAALTDVEHIGEWWGPDGFTTTTARMDVRPGGVWQFVMHGPDGRDYENYVIYDEVVQPERIAFHHTGEGEKVHHYTVITLEAEGDSTRVTLRVVFATAEERKRVAEEYHAVEGAEQNLTRLASFIESAKP
jgi:uncharacterized protein YndB with AHSA1/START domain